MSNVRLPRKQAVKQRKVRRRPLWSSIGSGVPSRRTCVTISSKRASQSASTDLALSARVPAMSSASCSFQAPKWSIYWTLKVITLIRPRLSRSRLSGPGLHLQLSYPIKKWQDCWYSQFSCRPSARQREEIRSLLTWRWEDSTLTRETLILCQRGLTALERLVSSHSVTQSHNRSLSSEKMMQRCAALHQSRHLGTQCPNRQSCLHVRKF